MEEGIGPLKELSPRSRNVRCLSWLNGSGICSVSLLKHKDRYSNFSKLKMLGGILPFKELLARSSLKRLVLRLENQLGIS